MSQSPDNSQQTSNIEPSQNIFDSDAAHYIPKELMNYVEDVEDFEEEIQAQIDKMIENELENEVRDEMEKQMDLESDDESNDEDKWLPDYKDCPCCHGYVYNCKEKICIAMGQCYCKMKDDIENGEAKCESNDYVSIDNNKEAVITNKN